MNDIDEAVIPGELRLQWIDTCRRRLPHETCGVVFGRNEGNRLYVEGFSVVRNVAADPSSAFLFDPDDWVRVWYDAAYSGRRIVGIFHSHPDGTACPSAADTQQRLNWGHYWIIGFTGQDAVLEAYCHGSAGQWRRLAQSIGG